MKNITTTEKTGVRSKVQGTRYKEGPINKVQEGSKDQGMKEGTRYKESTTDKIQGRHKQMT
jgi:hypothetical protein